MELPLRYKICQWPQAVKCLSNNSRKLKISVSDVLDGKTLQGTLVSVVHSDYGVLFAAMIDGQGEIISKKDPRGLPLAWMTTKEILTQLGKFGFDITYTERLTLNIETLDCLMRLKNLGFDKVTRIVVFDRHDGSLHKHIYPVAIQTKYNQDVLTYGTLITFRKFTERTSDGYMYNLENLDDFKLKWDWIDATYNIDDILSENSDIEEFEIYQGGHKIFPVIPTVYTEYVDNSNLTPYDESNDSNSGG